MGNLTVDPLAIGALVGFACLILISAGLVIWVVKQSGKAPGER